MPTINQRHRFDVATIFKEGEGRYRQSHRLSPGQWRAFHAICHCRTATLGGHLDKCNACGHQRIAYNSCRNRHCNKCQYTKQLVWVDKLKASLPVCRYFHIVFTLPQALHKLFYLDQGLCYSLLFKASAQALQKVADNPKFLGAKTGAVAVLHTWGQALTYHPHIHMLVPAGGLSKDGTEWIKAPKNFFLPVKVLSRVFRGILWSRLENEISLNKVRMPGDAPSIDHLKKQLYEKNWNVYAKKPLAGPGAVLRYLGRYTHRVAISNNRILEVKDGQVTFRWKDYRKGHQSKRLTLGVVEFIDRYMRHILPLGFYKIRYYGLLAPACKQEKQRCYTLIGEPQPAALLQGLKAKQIVQVVSGKNPDSCPKCKKGKLMPHTILDPV